jgi:nickel/cobalt exporter
VLLLSAIALRRVGLGLLLLVAFSLGLAIVLMGIGMIVIYAKHLLPESKAGGNPLFRWIPVASAAVVMALGLLMTGVSLGWLRPTWMVG